MSLLLIECLWPAVALGVVAVVIMPAIWSRHPDRRHAAMAVIRIILEFVTAVVVLLRRSPVQRPKFFADQLTPDEHRGFAEFGKPQEIAAYRRILGLLTETALSERESAELIATLATELYADREDHHDRP